MFDAALITSADAACVQVHAAWGDIDGNGHMRNTAYLDKAADARLRFFGAHGFPTAEFAHLRVGPVMLRDEIEYSREIHLHETVSLSIALAGLSADGSRFRIRNTFRKADGTLAARVTSTGGWLDLQQRRLTAPPPALMQAMLALPRSDDYTQLPGSARRT